MRFNNNKTGNRRHWNLDHVQRDQDDLIYKHLWGEGRHGLEETNTPMTHRTTTKNTRNRKRARHITWWDPSWNSSVKTNLERTFLNPVDKCFRRNHPRHKIFNRHTLKFTYSCMPNMKFIIASHNKTVLSNCSSTLAAEPFKQCNCRKKDHCSLERQYLTNKIVNQTTVTTGMTT